MASIQIHARSALVHARYVQVDEAAFFTPTEPPTIVAAPDDRLRRIEALDRIDNLAFLYFGDSRMEWILKWLNNIYLIPNDMVPGDEIRIPSFSRMERQGFVVR
jgi:hypothetical protein